MEKVNFNIGYQYLGVEYGLIPFIDIKYMDEKGREYDALENILLNKMENNQFLRSEVEEETLKLIEKCSSSATELSCAGIIDTTGRSYVASKGSFSNPLLEIPSRITINHKYLLNQDISVQDKCSIISKMFLNLYYNSKKKIVLVLDQMIVNHWILAFFMEILTLKKWIVFLQIWKQCFIQ